MFNWSWTSVFLDNWCSIVSDSDFPKKPDVHFKLNICLLRQNPLLPHIWLTFPKKPDVHLQLNICLLRRIHSTCHTEALLIVLTVDRSSFLLSLHFIGAPKDSPSRDGVLFVLILSICFLCIFSLCFLHLYWVSFLALVLVFFSPPLINN